ncbi:MAG: hypothetical protein MUF35_11440 [Candidatus Nanopelagicales bacterium]|jgi:hypothetical protein|nr:hypothetical protein [Candidatus Nanopelagicales bacterium]
MTDDPTTPADAGRPVAPQGLVAPMRRVLRTGALASAVALPAAALVGWLLAGIPGAWGALIGMGLAVAFFGITVAVALGTARMAPTQLGIWVLGSWLLKMVLLIVVLALLRDQDFYSRPALFVALLVGTAGTLVLEARVVTTTKVPYVEPGPR